VEFVFGAEIDLDNAAGAAPDDADFRPEGEAYPVLSGSGVHVDLRVGVVAPLTRQPVVQQLLFGRRRNRCQHQCVIGGGERREMVGGDFHGRPFAAAFFVTFLAAAFFAGCFSAAFFTAFFAAFFAGCFSAAFLGGLFLAACFAGAFLRL
jgi:hypothetical protein